MNPIKIGKSCARVSRGGLGGRVTRGGRRARGGEEDPDFVCRENPSNLLVASAYAPPQMGKYF